jgi:hypothetical protein
VRSLVTVPSWRQMNCSSSSSTKGAFWYDVQEEDLRGGGTSQSSRTCTSPPRGYLCYHLNGGNWFLYFVTAMGRLFFVAYIRQE